MTVVAYPLGRPRPAGSRGGDCRARDLGPGTVGATFTLTTEGGVALTTEGGATLGTDTLDLNQARNVHGPHRFAATTHCQFSNGLVQVTVGAAGVAPSLTLEAWRGAVPVGDVYVDTYADLYGGSLSAPAWFTIGTLTIDSPAVAALLTAVQLVRINPEALTIRLVAPLMADAFVTLRRGERQVRIQHGSTRAPLVAITRRIRITASPSPAGTASTGRVEEVSPAIDGFPRYVGSLVTATASAAAFSLTTASVTTARFGAGVGTLAMRDRPVDMHRQLADASRPRLVVT